MEPGQNRKPMWFWVAALSCIVGFGGFSFLWLVGRVLWHFK